jgi:hypothetical protein
MFGHMHRVTRVMCRSGGSIGASSAKTSRAGSLVGSLLVVGVLVLMGFGPAVTSAAAAPTTTVDLGQASTYAVFSGASVGNTVNVIGAPYTTLRGDLGVNANSQPTGFPPGVVTGTIRVGTTAAPADADLVTAYNEVAARTGGTVIAGDLAGLTLVPGLYSAAGAVSNTGTVTLDGGGDANAVFVFQVGGALNMAAGAQVVLTNGAQASNVFWQVNGAAAIGANATFAGTVMALNAIAVGAGTEVNGRALALDGAVSLNSNEFYSSPPTLTIAGGSTAITNDSTPTISGTTDLAPGVVSVTIAGQTLTATPSGGAWSVSSPILADGTYPVVASAIDGAGNQTIVSEQLTIDTIAPLVTITGGANATTSDVDPTITGTCNGAPGTTLTVTVAGQTITTLLQADGTWNTTPTALADGTYPIAVSVTDPAGNVGSATQLLAIVAEAPSGTGGTGSTGDSSTGGSTSGSTGDGPRLMLWLPVVSVKADRGRPVQVPFVLSGPATVTLTVLRDERVVATVSTRDRDAGSGWVTWDGKIKDKFATTGRYKIVVRADPPAGDATEEKATLDID